MKELKEKINDYVINLLLEVTGEDLDEVSGGLGLGPCYGCPSR